MTLLRFLLAGTVLIMAAGCATPPVSQYYTLSPALTQVAGSDAAQSVAPAKSYVIDVQPVIVPEQVDRPQIVISLSGSTEVQPLNNSLWASPLSEEIRIALSGDLVRQLGVLDIAERGAPDELPIWKIYLTVQRFDSVYDQSAVLEATWRLTPVNQKGKKVIICRARAQIPVEPGVAGLVAGHQEAVHRIAAAIAAQLTHRVVLSDISGLSMKACA